MVMKANLVQDQRLIDASRRSKALQQQQRRECEKLTAKLHIANRKVKILTKGLEAMKTSEDPAGLVGSTITKAENVKAERAGP